MKRFLATICLLLAGTAALAVEPGIPPAEAQERDRIEARRAAVESRFVAAEKDCYQQFAVTGCLNAARQVRRQELGELRQQELVLNSARRAREAQARIETINAKSSPEKLQQAEERRTRSLESSQRRMERLQGSQGAASAAAPASSAAGRAPLVASRRAQRQAADAAAAAAAQQEKTEEAARRKARRDKRLAERTKPAAAPLPPPH